MRWFCLLLLSASLFSCDPNRSPPAEAAPTAILSAGSMRATMREGQLAGTLRIDTLKRTHLYGLGPAEYLRGEVTVFDGVGYRSRVGGGDSIIMERTLALRPPFFVYTHQQGWPEYTLPSEVRSLPQLIDYIDELQTGYGEAIVFRLEGEVDRADFHIQNLAEGTILHNPAEAHRGQRQYTLRYRQVDLLGFFSRNHQGTYTHHDSYGHVHLLTRERDAMGHLDAVELGPGMKLYLSR